MGVIYRAPEPILKEDRSNHKVFLAGSIEMDTAENWQVRLEKKLVQIDGLTILNPRRENWNKDWKQSISHSKFKEQVDWELDGINMANTVLFYFDPNTKSPITLMELGLVAGMGYGTNTDKNVIVCCPDGFWRQGNVDILCSRMSNHNLIIERSLDKMIETSFEFITHQIN